MADTLKLVTLRNAFYKDNFRRVVIILLLSVLINIALLVSILFVSTRPTQVIYFASTNNGRLVPMKPLSEPVLTDQAVISWIDRTVPKIYSLDFLNYRSQINQFRIYFTKYGWEQFSRAFSGTLKQIIDNKYVSHAVPSDVPFILQKGIINGVFSWKVQVPLLVTFQQGDQEAVHKVVWTIILQRVANSKSNNQLLGISQIIQTIQQ